MPTWKRLAYYEETRPLWQVISTETEIVSARRQYLIANTFDLQGTIFLNAGSELVVFS